MIRDYGIVIVCDDPYHVHWWSGYIQYVRHINWHDIDQVGTHVWVGGKNGVKAQQILYKQRMVFSGKCFRIIVWSIYF